MVKKLILTVDRDNDFGEKIGREGPIVGKEELSRIVLEFGKKDPEDTDLNAVMKALALADELDAEVALVTGDKQMGYRADRKISEQLDRLKEKFGNVSVILVSDGASDDVVIPLIISRFKLESVQHVIVKQAKELEKTYMVILDKLKDPYYARIIFGIPALLLLGFSLISFFGVKWQFFSFIIGLYLLIKGFNLEEGFWNFLKEIKPSQKGIVWITYGLVIPILLVSLWISYDAFIRSEGLVFIKRTAFTLRPFVLLAPWAIGLILVAKTFEEFQRRNEIRAIHYLFYLFLLFLVSYVLNIAIKWILNDAPPYVSFGGFIETAVLGLFLTFALSELLNWVKAKIMLNKNPIGKPVFSKKYGYLGVCEAINGSSIVVRFPSGEKSAFPLSGVEEVGSRVILD